MHVTRRSFLRSGLGLAAGGVLADGVGFERLCIGIDGHELPQNAGPKLGLRVVQLADLHLQRVHAGLRALCRELSALQPDLILFTGDAVDRADKLPELAHLLGLLPAATPKIAVLGNWEYWGRVDPRALARLYAAHGGRLLVNESVTLPLGRHTVAITGLDDLLGGRPDYERALQSFQPADRHLVLTHCPEHADTIRASYQAQPPIDLILSGHTHGGQVNLLGFAPLRPPGSGRYVRGWYAEQLPPLFVSRGIGTSVLPLRLGARATAEVFYL
ncbi:metallophosphoesterase [Hymenobacter sp. 15J16-1T3B]|uniref:metallophosphoesterase n=1 Tax=Hymenobacter sp. 15J16-1T3B TaxID=2886941 RepID=UPI001D11030B|nr:metallophosphoesterase [Hymenobacter sp. 15J16-1T3B]